MNEHTGDSQRTRPSTGAYRDGWDRIFSPRNVSPVDGLLWKQEDEGSNPSVETKFTTKVAQEAYDKGFRKMEEERYMETLEDEIYKS